MKLQGLRVLDLSMFLPGPYLTLAMADHGAEVLKIESPGTGDPGRNIGPSDGPHTVFFRNLNRGKESLVLDLKTASGKSRFLELCETADVLVESFRPGVMQRLGLGYDTVRAVNRGIVFCSINAFGQTGRYADRAAHSLALEAMSGLAGMTVGRDETPAIPGIPVADVLSGLQALAGVLMALHRRRDTGEGDYLEVAMLDAAVSACANILGPTFAEGRQPVPAHERTTGGSAFYRYYATADGRFLALAGQEPKFVHALLAALRREDLAQLVLAGPGPHQGPVVAFLEQMFRTRTLSQWEGFLEGLDVCYGAVRTLPEAMADPHLEERGMIRRDVRGRLHLGSPIRFRHEPAQPVLQAPLLGEHAGWRIGSATTRDGESDAH